ncbi:ribosomal protein P1/P2 [Encephalitozoon hellem]|uniref:Acidic ribosomal protein P2 n=1 Tax=Encephalitozoon hellem TaxID=27973 RepID=A0A9Q9F9T1_ENCHE|nr:60S acidic ribosomal protein P2 [Encephalitozoon hellem ATCC 50504]AFM98534.1 60S acidic ribosomal protein P2 [Encephalitozoon hellem ATCC 50504]KAG5858588.1 ribosomal protein P1/P2 [Encephalitozoon hellem]UTX43477.1 acidic ribosomal protein P2 [Encephalitozoon hellem]WEL38951.1 acidic ribosomal protein P2 [Encephalitozoon hellem]|eukprot:XP_003887515.1 60S acidic ribosomal protein P2 [Encephalitozoon hellem ATCC 50504]
MEYVAAYVMFNKVGKEINEGSMADLFNAIGAEIEPETMRLFLSKVSDKSMEEVMSKGKELMASLAISSARESAPAQAADTPAPSQAAENKEEEEEDFDIFAAF